MTPDEAVAEVGWVVREAVELSKAPPAGASVAERTEYVRRWRGYEQRKRALIDYIEGRKR